MASSSIAVLTALVLVNFIGCVASQELLVLGNMDGADIGKSEDPKTTIPTRRPYSPLKPIQLPPHFQNLGVTLPPPPPPPIFMQDPHSHFLVELGQRDRFFFGGLFDQFKPLFSWLMPKPTTTTAAPPTTAASTPKPTAAPTDSPTTP